MSDVTEIREAYANADYVRLQTLQHERAAAYHDWVRDHPQREVVTEALAYIAEVMTLDDLRCKAAGYAPRPWQEALAAHNIIPTTAQTPFVKFYQEARH